jgi:hypothetical protein
MPFESSLPAGCQIVTEKNWRQFAKPMNADGTSESGYIERDYTVSPLFGGAGSPFPRELLIPESDWKEIIEERERKKMRLIDRCEASGVFTLDQDPSWYCWTYATTHGVMAAAISQNETPRTLCPESVAGPIMRYKKQGGWTSLSLEYIVKNGIADTTAWPWESHRQANDPKYFEGSRANAAQTKVPEFWDGMNREQKASALLRGIPVPDCYNYEGHATCSVELIWKDGQFGVIDIDSYYRRMGNKFHARARMGSRAWGSDAVGIRMVTPNLLGAA